MKDPKTAFILELVCFLIWTFLAVREFNGDGSWFKWLYLVAAAAALASAVLNFRKYRQAKAEEESK